MNGITVRATRSEDYSLISTILETAFEGTDEANLVRRLRQDKDVVLELVALNDKTVIGHILFSRLKVTGAQDFDAVALAPLAVSPSQQGQGAGSKLVRTAHAQLAAAGEILSVVLGEPEYYRRFGYERQLAAGFDSEYQGEYLQALAFGDAPQSGKLIYAPAFGAL
jgi:putative acetyltransferase